MISKRNELCDALEPILRDSACPSIDGALPSWPNDPAANEVWIGLHKDSFIYSHHSSFNSIIEDHCLTSSRQSKEIKDLHTLSESLLCIPKNDISKLRSILEKSKGGSVLVTGYRGTGKSSMVNCCVQQIIKEHNNYSGSRYEKTQEGYVPIRINLSTARDAYALVMLMIKELYLSMTNNEYPKTVKSKIKESYKRFISELTIKEGSGNELYVSVEAKKMPLPGRASIKKTQKKENTEKLNPYTLHEAQLDLHHRLSDLRKKGFKIIFIFDELDKLSPDQSHISTDYKRLRDIQNIVSDLKFLFTESNAYNIFIAGKDADDSWQEDQHKGDGLFESVFVQNIYNSSTLKAKLFPAVGPHEWIISRYNALMEATAEISGEKLEQVILNNDTTLPGDNTFEFFLETLFRKMSQTLGVEFGCCTYNTCLLILPYFSKNELWKIILSISTEEFDQTCRMLKVCIKLGIKKHINTSARHFAKNFVKANHVKDEVVMLNSWVNFNMCCNALKEENFKQETPITERRRRRIRFLMQYLTYKGHGIPRKILREMYSLVNHISVRKDKDEAYWKDRGDIKYIINIPSNLRKKIKFFANIVVILEQNNNFLRNLDDKGFVSIFYIIDYILKFFKTGFRWADIENANFMTQREEFYPGKTLASHLLDFLDQYLIESLDRRNHTYMLLPSIKRDLASLFLLFGPEQIELRFTKTDIANELIKLNSSMVESQTQEASQRFASFKSQLRIARLYELMGNHLEARHQYSKALRWMRSDILKYTEWNVFDRFTNASITTYVSSAIRALLRIGYLYELDREHRTSLHYYKSAIEFIIFACEQSQQSCQKTSSQAKNSQDDTNANSLLCSHILDSDCLFPRGKEDISILPNELIRKLYPYPNEDSAVAEHIDMADSSCLAMANKLLNKPLNTEFEPLGIKDTLILTAINYEKLWKPYACNRFLIFTLQYLYKKGDIQAYIEHVIFMGGFVIRRRDIRLASTIYIHIAKQLSEFYKKRSLIPPKVRMSIKAKLFECLGDVYYAAYGSTLISDHDIKELKKCIKEPLVECPGNNIGLCLEEDNLCCENRLKKWREMRKKAMEDIRGEWGIISISDDRDEELFYTQSRYFYAQSNQPLKQCDILMKKSKVRLEMFYKSMETLNFNCQKKENQTEDNLKIAIKSWCSFWLGIFKHLNILLGSDISKPTQHESKSLFFLDRKRYAKALVLIGRMFMSIQRRNLTDFIFEHKKIGGALSQEEIEKQTDVSNYYDLPKTNLLIESILNILTDNTKRKDEKSIINDENGIIEHIGNRSLLWRLFYTKNADIKVDSTGPKKYLAAAIKENSFLTGQLYLFSNFSFDKTDENSINHERNLRCLYWAEISLLNAQLSLNDSIRDHYSADAGVSLGILYMDAIEELFKLKQKLQKFSPEYAEANEFLAHLYSQLHIAAKRFLFHALDMMMVDKESERRLSHKLGEVYKHIGDLMIIRTEILYQIDNPGSDIGMFGDWQVLKDYLEVQKQHSIDDEINRTQIGVIKYYRKACTQYISELESYNKQYPFSSNLYHFHNNIMDSKIHYEICSMIRHRYSHPTAYRKIDNNEQINKIISKMDFVESQPFEITISGYEQWLYDFKELFSLVNELSLKENYIINITGDEDKGLGRVCFINIEQGADGLSNEQKISFESDFRHFFDPFKFCPLEV